MENRKIKTKQTTVEQYKEQLNSSMRNLLSNLYPDAEINYHIKCGIHNDITPTLLNKIKNMLTKPDLNDAQVSDIINECYNYYLNSIARYKFQIVKLISTHGVLNQIKTLYEDFQISETTNENKKNISALYKNDIFHETLSEKEIEMFKPLIKALTSILNTNSKKNFKGGVKHDKEAEKQLKSAFQEIDKTTDEAESNEISKTINEYVLEVCDNFINSNPDISKVLKKNIKSEQLKITNYKQEALKALTSTIYISFTNCLESNPFNKQKYNKIQKSVINEAHKKFIKNDNEYSSGEEGNVYRKQVGKLNPVHCFNHEEVKKTKVLGKTSQQALHKCHIRAIYNIIRNLRLDKGNINDIQKAYISAPSIFNSSTTLNILYKALKHKGYKRGDPIKILIPCSGYGGILTGAFEVFKQEGMLDNEDVKIVCIDANENLFKGYHDILKNIDFSEHHIDKILQCKQGLINQDYVNDFIKENNNNFDLIISCPPYFKLEEYPNSIQGNKYEEWKNNFLNPFCSIIKGSLKEDGIATIVVGPEGKDNNIPKDMTDILQEQGVKLYCSKKVQPSNTTTGKESCLMFTPNLEKLTHKEHSNDKYLDRIQITRSDKRWSKDKKFNSQDEKLTSKRKVEVVIDEFTQEESFKKSKSLKEYPNVNMLSKNEEQIISQENCGRSAGI